MNGIYNKKNRVLDIFFRMLKGESVSVKRLAKEYAVSNKTITRDINEIKDFIAENRISGNNLILEYSYSDCCYRILYDKYFMAKEIFAIIKVIIGSRAFSRVELMELISKFKTLTTNHEQQLLDNLIQNEMLYYHSIHHDCGSLVDTIWNLVYAIDTKNEIKIIYYKQSRDKIERKVKPIAIIFSEYYFYLLAYNEESNTKTKFYRIDRITDIQMSKTKFKIQIQDFDEGLLKEKIQYMYPGVYRRIKFEFIGPSVQAVLDKFPTARIVSNENGKYIIEAFVYGAGVTMFLLSQGSWVKVLEPSEYVNEIKNEIRNMNNRYID